VLRLDTVSGEFFKPNAVERRMLRLYHTSCSFAGNRRISFAGNRCISFAENRYISFAGNRRISFAEI
jgi:hypothetical protein